MSFGEMLLQGLVVQVILRMAATISPVTDVTFLVLLTAMCIKLVISVESFLTETTFWVASETGLINRAWIIVPKFGMFPELSMCEKLVLMSEDFLIPCAEITHDLTMLRSDMTMQIWPSQTRSLAIFVGTVVTEEKNGVFENDISLVLDTEVFVDLGKVTVEKVFELLGRVICKDDKIRFGLART